VLYFHNPMYLLLECLLTEEEGEDSVASGFAFVASCETGYIQENCLWFHCPEVDSLLNTFAAEDPTPAQWRHLHRLLLNKWPSLTLYARFGCPHLLFESLLRRCESRGQQKETSTFFLTSGWQGVN
jgi:hypothetical protein